MASCKHGVGDLLNPLDIGCRLANDKDAHAISILLKALGYNVEADDVILRLKNIRQYDGEVFVAETRTRKKVVACINVLVDVRLAAGKVGEIASLVVHEQHRSRGVGKVLVEYAESWLYERCDKIRIRANEKRKHAHEFYQRLGYNEQKTQKVFVKPS